MRVCFTMATGTAKKRLMRDFKRLTKDPPSGISAAPVGNDIMTWQAVIFGCVYAALFAAKRASSVELFSSRVPLTQPPSEPTPLLLVGVPLLSLPVGVPLLCVGRRSRVAVSLSPAFPSLTSHPLTHISLSFLTLSPAASRPTLQRPRLLAPQA